MALVTLNPSISWRMIANSVTGGGGEGDGGAGWFLKNGYILREGVTMK